MLPPKRSCYVTKKGNQVLYENKRGHRAYTVRSKQGGTLTIKISKRFSNKYERIIRNAMYGGAV